MPTIGIVAEYNPFHNGHFYQIQKIRELIPDSTIVCVMSGNLVQRGELAVISKYDRAEAAVKCGADVVFELPSVFSSASANIFASSAIYILEKTGGVDYLCFGSECGDLQRLERTAERLNSGEFSSKLKSNIKNNASSSFAKNTASTYEEIYGIDDRDIFNGSNNILGIEYLKALRNFNSKIKPMTIERIGSGYNSREIDSVSASATAIRNFLSRINNGNNDITVLEKAMPVESYAKLAECVKLGRFADIKNIETAVISHIRRLDCGEMRRCAEIFYGDEYRIKEAAENVFSYNELTESLKAKHYTESGVRRMILNVFFGITKEMRKEPPQFTTLLGFNKLRGQKLLNGMKKTAEIKIITKPASANKTQLYRGESFLEAFKKNLFIDNIYKLALYNCSGEINEIKRKPYVY